MERITAPGNGALHVRPGPGASCLVSVNTTRPSGGHCHPSAEEMRAPWSKETCSRSHREEGAESGSQNLTLHHYTNIRLYRD